MDNRALTSRYLLNEKKRKRSTWFRRMWSSCPEKAFALEARANQESRAVHLYRRPFNERHHHVFLFDEVGRTPPPRPPTWVPSITGSATSQRTYISRAGRRGSLPPRGPGNGGGWQMEEGGSRFPTSPGATSQPLSRPSLTKGSCPSLHSSLVRHAHNGSTSTICGQPHPPKSGITHHPWAPCSNTTPGAPPPASRLALWPWGGPRGSGFIATPPQQLIQICWAITRTKTVPVLRCWQKKVRGKKTKQPSTSFSWDAVYDPEQDETVSKNEALTKRNFISMELSSGKISNVYDEDLWRYRVLRWLSSTQILLF